MLALRGIFLILVVLLGQAHACRAYYALPSGQLCVTCPTEQCDFNLAPVDEEETAHSIASGKSDCHYCCNLKSCETDDKPEARALAPFVFYSLPPPAFAFVPFVPVFQRSNISVHVEQQYAHAPPAAHGSRAPPFQRI